jgi:flagellar hook assembly protein FlgD
MRHNKKEILLSCCLFLTLFFCNEYPAAPKYNGIGDCTKATIPQGLQFDSNQTYSYLEIYDYEKNLINIAGGRTSYEGPPPIVDTTGIFNYDVYWNGMDRNGNKVDNGKYIAKMSIISKRDTSCMCGEVIIK